MCLCCLCCCKGPKRYAVPRYKYHTVTFWDLLVPVSLAAVLVAIICVKPIAEDVRWGMPLPVRSPSLESQVMEFVERMVRSLSDAIAFVETVEFNRSHVFFEAPQPIDNEANAAAKEAAEERLYNAYARAEGTNEDYDDNTALTQETEDRSLLFVTEDVEDFFGCTIRLFKPLNPCTVQVPVVVYFHNGGFVLNSARSTTSAFIAQKVMEKTGAIVVSVEYREAPEYPFPAAVEDAEIALQYVFSGALGPLANLSHVVLFGDEAGGNLAAVATMLRRDRVADRSGPRLAKIVPEDDGTMPVHSFICLYPWFFVKNSTSRLRFKDKYLLRDSRLDWYEAQYRQSPEAEKGLEDLLYPALSKKGLEGMPDAHIFTCGNCPLQVDSAQFIEELKKANVPVDHKHDPYCINGFINCPFIRHDEGFWSWLRDAVLS